jgi:SAM-dependent methyltransferase
MKTSSKSRVSSEAIISFYRNIGIDVSRLLGNVPFFELCEDSSGLKQWFPSVPGDSKFYQDLSDLSWYYSKNKPEFDVAIPLINDQSVLEIGCGFGFFADLGSFNSYIGLELNSAAVSVAINKGLDVRKQPFEDYSLLNPASVEAVCSFQVLEHLPDPSSYFIAAYHVLVGGGLLITSVPSESSFVGCLHNNILNAPPHHLTRWSDEALTNYPKQFGFECIDLIHLPVEDPHRQWFWDSLLEQGFMRPTRAGLSMQPNTLAKIRRVLSVWLLKMMGFSFSVPSDFCIPGHTVVAVHKKIS